LYPQIGATVSNQFELPDFEKSSTVSHRFETKPEVLVSNLSFSHIREIMVIEDAFGCTFRIDNPCSEDLLFMKEMVNIRLAPVAEIVLNLISHLLVLTIWTGNTLY